MDILEALGPFLSGVTSSFVASWLGRRLKALPDYLGEQQKKTALQTEAMRHHPRLCDYLSHRLNRQQIKVGNEPAQLMERLLDGQRLTIPACLVREGQNVSLGDLTERPTQTFKWEGTEYVKAQQLLGRRIEDNPVFTAERIELSGSDAVIQGGMSTYCPSLATQDALEWELLVEAGQHFPLLYQADFPRLDGRLAQRAQAERAAGHDLLSGMGRSNAIAIATLIVYKGAMGEYRAVVGKRSSETAAHADLFHVIPAGMFQPEFGRPGEEWDIQHNVLKEYGEELFDREVDHRNRDSRYFYKRWSPEPRSYCVRDLREKLREGNCIFKVTGLIVNLLNLRPEVCTLLLVKDAEWWEAQRSLMKGNWEYLPLKEAKDENGKAVTEFQLDRIEKDYLNSFRCESGWWTAPGLAALWLGVDAARKELQGQP